MSDLADLVEPLKREVAVPGTFAGLHVETTDDELAASLLDAFAQCQLDGFFGHSVADDNGIVTPDLSRGANALVVIYGGIRLLTAEIINRKSHVQYQAGTAVFVQDYAASVLTQALKDMQARKSAIITLAQTGITTTTVVDGYLIRAMDGFALTSYDTLGAMFFAGEFNLGSGSMPYLA